MCDVPCVRSVLCVMCCVEMAHELAEDEEGGEGEDSKDQLYQPSTSAGVYIVHVHVYIHFHMRTHTHTHTHTQL